MRKHTLEDLMKKQQKLITKLQKAQAEMDAAMDKVKANGEEINKKIKRQNDSGHPNFPLLSRDPSTNEIVTSDLCEIGDLLC